MTLTQKTIKELVRPNIAQLKPYSSARDEFKGAADVFLDANENPFDTAFNRYPDPLASAVKKAVSELKNIPENQIAFGNGSDEIIDLVYRIFCKPGEDNVITLPPTYGMYKVYADINNVAIQTIPLLEGFEPNTPVILNAQNEQTKVLWLCSPNNPSGNDFSKENIMQLLENFQGIVVIDEAYADFAKRNSYADLLSQFSNLIIMQTFSKAWGLAGIRLGMAFASAEIIQLINAVKPPYNINNLSQKAALNALRNRDEFQSRLSIILDQRAVLEKQLKAFSFIQKIYPSATNFLLLKVDNATELYEFLQKKGIIVRNRSKQLLCENCLRITVGTAVENARLIETLQTYSQ